MNRHCKYFFLVVLCTLFASFSRLAVAQDTGQVADKQSKENRMNVNAIRIGVHVDESVDLPSQPASAIIADWCRAFAADLKTFDYRFRVPLDDSAADLHEQLLNQWLVKIEAVEFDELTRSAQVDFLLLKNEVEFQIFELRRRVALDMKAKKFAPQLNDIVELCVIRENVIDFDPEQAAGRYAEIAEELNELKLGVAAGQYNETVLPTEALHIASELGKLRSTFKESHDFYMGYDPMYSWWAEKPYQQLDAAMYSLRSAVSSKIAGVSLNDQNRIVGQPIGDEAIAAALKHAMIPYSPAELVAIAEREFEWCDREIERAATELGFDKDWRSALEAIKSLHVDPGQQPQMVKDLAWEAIDFLRQKDLLTIPPLAANGWRMSMMSPSAQKTAPYFLGGPQIIVAFPTNDMSHAEKLMSLRSNNVHFARATVHHELIPGHHMQHYASPRFNSHRQVFNTPFWLEGWALYWEMRLWDLNFHNGPEDRMGMLFWRRHRCARIVFSLNYQSGKWSAEQCVDYLIKTVGHEDAAANAEVRRSVMGDYGPLYQAAYMLGGLQIRALFDELVKTGKMPEKQFHDSVLRQNSIPIEMVRAALSDVKLSKSYETNWRFAGELHEAKE